MAGIVAQFAPEYPLADLYDPNTMPPELVKAHQALDKAVDLCYRPQPFINETKRIEFLFEMYDKLTRGMFGGEEEKEEIKKPVICCLLGKLNFFSELRVFETCISIINNLK